MTCLLLPMSSWHTFLPPTVLFGVAPFYYTASSSLRLLKCVLPSTVYEKLDVSMYHSYQSMVVYFFENFAGNKLLFYGDRIPLDKQENIIYMSNHKSSIDWSIANFFGIRQGTIGKIRYILKSVLRYLPMFGPYFFQHGCIFVSKKSKGQDMKVKKSLEDFANTNHHGYWMVIFPEGTRYKMDDKMLLEKSETKAKECGYEPFKHLLFPRTKAFEIALEELSGSLDAIYDITLAFKVPWLPLVTNELGPNLFEMVSIYGREIHLHVRRIGIENIPKDIEERREWLYSTFQEKDKLMAHFYDPSSNGTFPGEQYEMPLRLHQTLPFVSFYTALLFLSLSTSLGRDIYKKLCILGYGSIFIMPLLYKIQEY